MLFENRKILVGFRIKLNFDATLKKENSYVFVNLSVTPTIKDLLDSIKKRFEIPTDIYIALNDCRLLNCEDNSVLIDVDEVKVAPCKNEKNNTETSLRSEILQSDSSSKFDNVAQTVESNVFSDKTEVSPAHDEQSCDKKQNNSVFRTGESTNRKPRRYYSSIAETLKYINQNYKLEMENTSKLSNDVLTPESEDCQKEKELNVVKQQDTVDNVETSCYVNDASFEKMDDQFVEKRKRKRKRKHSKKSNFESDHSEVIHNTHDQYADSNVEENTNNIPTKSTRQHIFFNVEDDRSTKDDEPSTDCNFSVDSSPQIRSFNKKLRKLESTAENEENNAADTNGINDVTDSANSTLGKNENIEKNSISIDPSNQSSESETKFTNERENSCAKRLESEDSDSLPSTNTKHPTPRKKSTDSQSKQPLNNGFFSTLKAFANSRSNFQTKEIPSESPHPLSTLLMCKQLQTPVEYSVQFTPTNGIPRSRSNSCVSVDSRKSTNNIRTSIPNSTSTVSIDSGNRNANDDEECEVLCHYKIVHDKVLLRDSNGTWNILSDKDASLKLQPVQEPQENDSITFQLLYLGPDMCPSMSDLICGKVISFKKESCQLILNILPAFIEALLKNFGEDACLPDELVHITENTYQISWIAVKNPRLLM